MAPLSNYISFLLLTTLLLPLQTTARDSQFFSKVTHFNTETKIPNKEESTVTVTNKPDEQPPFIPQNENSYGLYGHESDSDHFPSTTTTTNSKFEDTNNYQNDNKYYNNDAYNTKYYNKDTFGNELSDTKYNEEGYNNNNQNHRFNNNAANERSFYNNNNNNYNAHENNMYNGEKQGMSDTRFLEGGKYYYDVSYEKYNPTMYSDSSRGMNNNNWYNNRGNSNNDNNYGNNNEYYQNNHGNYNGYKNQHEFENEEDAFKP